MGAGGSVMRARVPRRAPRLLLLPLPKNPYTLIHHPGGSQGVNLKSSSHRCYFREVAFEWELTKETIYLPLGCLQGGIG